MTFGHSSSLKRIGIESLYGSDLREIHIPDSVRELCAKCFYQCDSLSRVTFGESSSLKKIGKDAFSKTGVRQIHLPDKVGEICLAYIGLPAGI